ncbi:MAG: ATP-binding protein [Acetobacteraceae bacterium]
MSETRSGSDGARGGGNAADPRALPLPTDGRLPHLANVAAAPAQQWLTAGFIAVSLVVIVMISPFAHYPLPRLPEFVVMSLAVLVTFDLVIVALLYGQVLIRCSRAMLALLAGYTLAAVMTAARLVTFPGVFVPGDAGVVGAQSAAWFYWFWHGGFLVAVVAYAMLRRYDHVACARPHAAFLLTMLGTIGVSMALVWLTVRGQPMLPVLIVPDDRGAPIVETLSLAFVMVGVVALALLMRNRPRTVLDLSLMAIVWAWILDIVTSTFLSTARYQLGFYVGRLFGALAVGLMLFALVVNINRLHRRHVAIAAELDSEVEDLRRLHDVATRLVGHTDMKHVLEDILDATMELQQADFGTLHLYDPETGMLRIAVQRGLPPAFLDHFAVVSMHDISACGQAAERKERVVIHDVLTDDAIAPYREIAMQAGIRGVHSTPVMGRDGSLKGVLSTQFRHPIDPAPRELHLTDLHIRLAGELLEWAEAERKLQDLAHRAEEANRAKDRFLATASHDLRQPLQALVLFNGLLQRTVTDAKPAAAIAGQEQAITTMSELLNYLLDISTLQSGTVRPRMVEIDLDHLMRSLSTEFAPLASQKGLAFETTGCGLTVRSDPTLLGQILRNLISNAIRYTSIGSVRLSCAREDDRVRIDITDTGVGIAADEQSRIFDDFYQVGIRPQATREGHGLGLSVVQRAIQLLGYEISVRSRPAEGSIFSVLIPEISSETHSNADIAVRADARTPHVTRDPDRGG